MQAQGAHIAHASGDNVDSVELDFGGEAGARSLRIGTGTSAGRRPDSDASARGPVRWSEFDLAHGLPRLPIAQSEAWTPQMLSLERLNAFSLRKGCYPGQEIVARTHYLGQAKRALVRIAGTSLHAGNALTVAGQAIGTVVSAAGTEAVAVVSADRPDHAWDCDGVPCRPLPLLAGLAR